VKTPISDYDVRGLVKVLEIEPYQARQIFRWLHHKCVFDFQRMTDLSKALRDRLEADYAATQLLPVTTKRSPVTGTKKTLFRLADGETVESVLIRDRDRVTVCVSSQAGCPLGCAFCATGQAGFARNLSAGEIAEQVLYLLRHEDLGGRTPNIVYMGMGEPFLNYDAVMASIRLLMTPFGQGIGARKITVSTVGDAPGIERFAQEDWQVRLSVSLHAANNPLRDRLAPLNRKYPLEQIREALLEYMSRKNRQITFEWVLLEEINDTQRDAEELVAFATGMKASVNLIPWNPVPGIAFQPSAKKRRDQFLLWLAEGGLAATVRQEKGQDIDAACGQLRRMHRANLPMSGR